MANSSLQGLGDSKLGFSLLPSPAFTAQRETWKPPAFGKLLACQTLPQAHSTHSISRLLSLHVRLFPECGQEEKATKINVYKHMRFVASRQLGEEAPLIH